MIKPLLIFSLGLCVWSVAMAANPSSPLEEKTKSPLPGKAKQLKAFIQKEKNNFETRESKKKDVLGELDRINEEQNKVRERVSSIAMSQTEIAMALENLSLEYNRQKELEQLHRKRMYLLLKVAYRIKKEGMLRFVFTGQDLGQLTARIRVLYRTLRSHTVATQQLQERANRLAESEKELSEAKKEQQALLDELKSQQQILNSILDKKRQVLVQINKKQNYYQLALKEYKRLTAELNSLFSQFDSSQSELPGNEDNERQPFVFPVAGKIVQGFGKTVNQKFGTVIYHKGIQIEAEHNSPVGAVAPGIIEYSGWVRGLGNVAILKHGPGLYTLSAHLFKITKDVGAKVLQGETIGTVGDTGASDKPSLYFEVREKGKAVDPVAYFAPESLTYIN
jgi:septal ring factor EnvC (AmiA/AmiB activator)